MYVVFAVGRDVEPMVPLVASRLKDDPQSRFLVFYGTEGVPHGTAVEELLALKDLHLDRLSLCMIMNREPEEAPLLSGRLDAGKVRAFGTRLFDPRAVREYFVSGPASLISDVGAALQGLGVEAGRIRAERFAAQSVPAGGERSGDSQRGIEGVTQVAVIMDGRRTVFAMRTGEERILDAAARAGVDLPFSCKAGVCSTCRTKLVRGKVVLAENYALEDWELERGFILACQAHAQTPDIELNYDER